ncbi:SGNH hydrolase [Abortiporus biennis]|nr:SGNH hydrolase [Abortiporus biennis]
MEIFRNISQALLTVLLIFTVANAISPDPADGHWVDTWTSMPQLTETSNLPPAPFTQSNVVFQNATIRQTLHLSTGAKQIRIRISNAFGTTDLPITAATIALPLNGSAGASAIIPSTLQMITFSGNSSIDIPNGALVVSDPIAMQVNPQSMITVTLYLAQGQTTNDITSHPGSRTTSWFSPGNHVTDSDVKSVVGTLSAEHWYFVSAVEAWSPSSTRAFVVVGDSITDGRGSTTNENDRWPDQLLTLMQANPSTSDIAVVNQAAGGNNILHDGLGPNAFGRIERDVLAQSGVGYVMIFEGVNDIGGAASSTINSVGDRIIQAYKQIITRVHAMGLPIFAATITPFFSNSYFTNQTEATRQKINDWIRNSGFFDAVVDFDVAIRDPTNPQRLNPLFDSGDGLHPNPAGYKTLANAFNLTLFDTFSSGVIGFQ